MSSLRLRQREHAQPLGYETRSVPSFGNIKAGATWWKILLGCAALAFGVYQVAWSWGYMSIEEEELPALRRFTSSTPFVFLHIPKVRRRLGI